ncbi:unnamed protein product [Vitrella brassicaformis CCMP3155]|uniref:Uncharacterized protein n=1 Tax=Vitrella brassicaformis (strain CCMP3155) TaxID=1169540 RepID=A0A0G4EA88_VITBC|nr:unnamed protein product [Vitrella brassicaformis CCMP3155]|eukprot:CEL92867.1 unnamed protein product [Vitrella brassicaformis CCMP3155]
MRSLTHTVGDTEPPTLPTARPAEADTPVRRVELSIDTGRPGERVDQRPGHCWGCERGGRADGLPSQPRQLNDRRGCAFVGIAKIWPIASPEVHISCMSDNNRTNVAIDSTDGQRDAIAEGHVRNVTTEGRSNQYQLSAA